jgi:hypothetical protein
MKVCTSSVLLQVNPPLIHVNLSGNGITDVVAPWPSWHRLFQYHPTLRELLLGWNGIVDINDGSAEAVTKSQAANLDLAGVSE